MNIKGKIEKWIRENTEIQNPVLLHPKELENGDYTLIVNDARENVGAEEIFNRLQNKKIPEISDISFVAPRFINIFLSKEFFAEAVEEINKNKESFGETDLLKEEKIIIEHTQPNPFKEFHIGHLMNNAIGESVSRIMKASGAEVRTCSYHGDVGLHVAKTIWGKMQKPELSWGKAYAYGSQNYEGNENEIIEINKKVYDRSDKEINRLYEQGRKESLENFEKTYEKLDSKFDFNFFESDSGPVGKEIVKENVGKIFEESEGAVVFRGENFEPKTHTRVFLSKEGLPTYEAKELGLAKIKKEKWPGYTKSITVTANEQDGFFNVVEVAIGEIYPELKGKLTHLSHGMLRLPQGKMSSRTGNIITAESLIDQVKDKVLEKIKDREFSTEEKENISEMVAIGAIKYSILRQAIGGDIIFDFDKSISFEGDSGPYLQYACVRANSILEKANLPKNVFSKKSSGLLALLGQTIFSKSSLGGLYKQSENWKTTEIERLLYRLPEVVERAGREYAPHHIVTYLLELAGSFNSFYAKEKILNESDPASPYKIALTQSVYYTLKNGLHLLGIKVPERM